MMNIVTAITGASGALYAQRFIQGLVQANVNVHLVVSPLGLEQAANDDRERCRVGLTRPTKAVTEVEAAR
jgi:3-polyprenyl-4-hydroxybenzoate decarboxylase